ncbi:enoyl-CoA hydratase [Sciscionella marina]|uniref:enoyl-CoA hydratase n=1 Tax=Sciscionella marina TaxID=508770 RepID=UPI00036922A1|nr:enoyl-CoA hydratase [Sciscionella marina]
MDTNDSSRLVFEERHGDTALVQLNRPEALNALSPELMLALTQKLEQLDNDRGVRAVVIAGHDRAFVAGADIKSMRDRTLETVLTQASNKFYFRLAALEVPLVAAVSGWALGGGCELALACDLVVASETAVFSQAEINVGIMPGGGGTQRLARTIGKHRAMELVLTGKRVSATEAAELGFVNRIVTADLWRTAAIELAQEIAARPPLAVRMAKRAVLTAEESTLSAGMSAERRLMELTYATEDRVEGMSAFIEHRKPQWTGR